MVSLLPLLAVGQDDGDKPTFPLDNFYAERKKWPRVILKDFHLGVSLGYGNTFYNHNLDGFGVVQPQGTTPRIFPVGSTDRYQNWVNKVVADTVTTGPSDIFVVSSDTTKLGFKGRSWNIPVKATLHYEFLERYRLGGGYSYEYMHLGALRSKTFADRISDLQPSQPGGFMQKYFGSLGISFYRWQDFLFTGDVEIGGYKPGKNFDTSLIKKGIYVNGGVTIERAFSEYLRAFVRPSFEIKNYTMTVGSGSINHSMDAFYVNVGLSYSLPELPKCYHKDCQAQINHAHGDREYRSRMHRIFKKQNPMYGENYPRLIKYKGKNKKKLNPY